MRSIASLQRGIVAAALGLAAVGSCLAWQSGSIAWALAWPLMVAMAHGPLLAFECLWAAAVNRRTASRKPMGADLGNVVPAASALQWLMAWAAELRHALRVFAWQQPFASAREPDHLPAGAAGQRGVLLVHGFVCNRGFWNTWLRRLRARGIPVVAVTAEPTFGDIAAQAAVLQPAYDALWRVTGREPLLVGHSMGGLLIRAWCAGLSGVEGPRDPQGVEVVTLGSPHYGTALAELGHTTAALQMRLLSPFLQRLAQAEIDRRPQGTWAGFTCVWSNADHIVFPASTATLPGARTVLVPGQPHVGLAEDARSWQTVMDRLSADRPVAALA